MTWKDKHYKSRAGRISHLASNRRWKNRIEGKLPPLELHDGADKAAEAAGL